MDLRNSNGFELRKTLTLQPYRSFCRKFSSEVDMQSSIQVLPNQVGKKCV